MESIQIRDLIADNRRYIQLKSNIAVQNLTRLHASFDHVDDAGCRLSLALNDSMAALIFDSDHARSIQISRRAQDQYGDSGHSLLLAQHEAAIGRSYTMWHRHEQGREHLQRALKQSMLLHDADEEVIGLRADILHDLAMNNQYAGGDPGQSLTYLDRALEILAPTSFHSRQGVCLMGKGNVRFTAETLEDALAFYLQAERYFAGSENMGNLASVFCNIGLCYVNLNRFDDAGPYLHRALDLRMRMGGYWDISNSYYNLAQYHRLRHEVHEAYDHLMLARDYAFIGSARHLKIASLEMLAELATAMGRTADAAKHLKDLEVVKASV